jgi:hypothetical protein
MPTADLVKTGPKAGLQRYRLGPNPYVWSPVFAVQVHPQTAYLHTPALTYPTDSITCRKGKLKFKDRLSPNYPS